METTAGFAPNYASFPQRFAATAVDVLILILPGFLFSMVFPIFGGLLLWFLYCPFLESSRLQATIGKKVMGIHVSSVSGKRLSFSFALVRCLVKSLSSALCFFPHLLALFTEKHQALHDLVSDSVVLRGTIEGDVAEAWMEVAKGLGKQISAPATEGKIGELERLQALLEKGTLTREEFEQEKKKILER